MQSVQRQEKVEHEWRVMLVLVRSPRGIRYIYVCRLIHVSDANFASPFPLTESSMTRLPSATEKLTP